MKVKVFANPFESILETDINAWFAQNPNVAVRFVSQSETADGRYSVSVCVWYEEVQP